MVGARREPPAGRLRNGPGRAQRPGAARFHEVAAQFQADAVACQQHAEAALGGVTAGQAYNETVAANAIAGTALGAATGALIGAATGQAGAGAAIGAGTGLLFGTAAGTNVAGFSYADVQRRYDSVYLRCMYAKGNRVPTRTVQRLAPPTAVAPIYPPSNTAAPAWPPANAQAPAYPPPNTPPVDRHRTRRRRGIRRQARRPRRTRRRTRRPRSDCRLPAAEPARASRPRPDSAMSYDTRRRSTAWVGARRPAVHSQAPDSSAGAQCA